MGLFTSTPEEKIAAIDKKIKKLEKKAGEINREMLHGRRVVDSLSLTGRAYDDMLSRLNRIKRKLIALREKRKELEQEIKK